MLLKILKILGVLISLFCIMNSSKFTAAIWLLPLFYTFFIYYIAQEKDFKTPGIIALQITMIGRYLIVPFAYYLDGGMSEMASSYKNINLAVYLMLYEQFFIFLAIKITRTLDARNKKAINAYYDTEKIKLFIMFVIFIWVVIASTSKSLVDNFLILLTGAIYLYKENDVVGTSSSNFVNTLWQCISVLLFIYFVIREKNKYDKDNRTIHVYKSVMWGLILIVISFIDQSGLSRWFTIITSSSCIAVLTHLYNKETHIVKSVLILPSVIIITIATLVKNGGFLIASGSVEDSGSALFSPTALDMYFSGPTGVNSAINMCEQYHIEIKSIIYDIVNNLPVVNHYIPKRETTVYLYNLYLGRIYDSDSGDQIIPLIGQGYSYFGFLLAPLFSFVCLYIIRYCDSKFKNDYSFTTYLWAFIGVWFGVEIMALNMTITMSWIYWRIIPFAIILFFTNKITKSNKTLR